MDAMDIMDFMDIMEIMEIIDIINIMNITAWMAMAGAVSGFVYTPALREHAVMRYHV